jgi:hypothetical protein
VWGGSQELGVGGALLRWRWRQRQAQHERRGDIGMVVVCAPQPYLSGCHIRQRGQAGCIGLHAASQLAHRPCQLGKLRQRRHGRDRGVARPCAAHTHRTSRGRFRERERALGTRRGRGGTTGWCTGGRWGELMRVDVQLAAAAQGARPWFRCQPSTRVGTPHTDGPPVSRCRAEFNTSSDCCGTLGAAEAGGRREVTSTRPRAARFMFRAAPRRHTRGAGGVGVRERPVRRRG